MKLITFFLICMSNIAYTQQMNIDILSEIITKNADTIAGIPGNWKFSYKKTPMLCIADVNNNRMRIISPIMKSTDLDKNLLLDAMTANFHSALDVRYAIASDILWVAYIHPFKELTIVQIEDAISQVYHAHATFGTTFSSTPLLFNTQRKENRLEQKMDTETLPKF